MKTDISGLIGQGREEREPFESLNLKDRKYVDVVLNQPNKLWRLNRKDGDFRFYLQPITSWTTGWNSVVASMSSPPKGDDPTIEKRRWVAAIEFRFLSLMDGIVLPPGVGFAVLDNSKYQVLFHSKSIRNLRENFLVETDQDPLLHNLLNAGSTGHVEGTYWGNDTHFYTLPLHPLPWSLVVYRDEEMLQSINFVVLLVGGGLFSLWAIIVYGSLWLWLRRPMVHQKSPWIWPTAQNHPRYLVAQGFNLFFFVLGVSLLWTFHSSPGSQLLIALILLPLVWFVSGMVLAKFIPSNWGRSQDTPAGFQGERIMRGPWISRVWAYPRSYSFMVSSFLLILAVLPAHACFTAIFHEAMSLMVKHQLSALYQNFQTSGKTPVMFKRPSENQNPIEMDSLILASINSKKTFKAVPFFEDCNNPGHTSLGVYPDFFLTTTWCASENPQTAMVPILSFFERLFQWLSQPFVPLLKQSPIWGFIGNVHSDDDHDSKTIEGRGLSWSQKKSNVSLMANLLNWERGFTVKQTKVSIEGSREYDSFPNQYRC